MSQFPDRLFIRLALIGLIAASLGLAACGRKGPLDPPPSAAAAPGEGEPADNKPSIRSPFERPGDDEQIRANTVPDRPFILDPLLN